MSAINPSTNDFVDLPFTTTSTDLEDAAMAYLQDQWGTNYTPADGDPEVILIEALSPMAAAAMEIAANMPKQALIAFGVQLLNQPYAQGTSAYTSVIFTVKDNAGYTIPAGSQLEIDGYAFSLPADAVVPALSTSVEALVASTERTADANGLTGTTVAPVMMPGFVTSMVLAYPTDGGSDPQDDDDYADQVSRDRRLTSKAVITALDFELLALDQQGIARAHADMSTGRNVTVTLLATNGGVVSAAIKTSLANLYAAQRIVNAVVTIADPNFSTINVTYTAQGESGFDATDLASRINAALVNELSPLTHGVPESGDPGNALTTWINDPAIYVNRMIQVIGGVLGVHRVTAISLSGTLGAKLSAALSTAAPITSLPVTGSTVVNTIPSGSVITIKSADGAHTQNWTTTAQVNPAATTIPVASQTPNFAYDATAVLSGPVSGDLVMSGAVPVPQPGTMTGTIVP